MVNNTPRGGRRPFPPRRAKTDLTGFLTHEENLALIALIGEITRRMDVQITNTFIPIIPVKIDDKSSSNTAFGGKENSTASQNGSRPSVPGYSKTQQTALKSYSNAHVPAADQVSEVARRDAQHDVQAKAGKPQHQELKKELLAIFRKWQTNLHIRIEDVFVKPSSDGTPVMSHRGGRGTGRGTRGGRGDHESPRGGSRSAGAALRGGTRGGFLRPVVRLPGQAMTPPVNDLDPYLKRRFPPSYTWLSGLPLDKRKLLLHATMLLVLSMETYSAFARILMLHLASSLGLSMEILFEDENRVARGLGSAAAGVDLDAILQQKTTESKKSRKWKAAGAALIGSAGALAAPLASAGISCVEGGIKLSDTAAAGLLGSVAHNGIVVGNMFGVYAGRDTGKMIDQYGKDSADFALLSLNGTSEEGYRDAKLVPPSSRRMKFAIGVSGWLTKEDGFVVPFQCFGPQAECFTLRYEVENLMSLGTALELVIKSATWAMVKKEMNRRHVMTCLKDGKWPVGLVRVSKILDNPWSIGMVRCEKAGMALAECIGRKTQGDRPVSLVGYSLGARVIYTCLMALAERRQFGLVESVVIIGAPAPSDPGIWCAMKSVVSSRLINIFSENDYVLGFLYRTSNTHSGVAGLEPVTGVEGVENFSVSRGFNGHFRYQFMVGSILKMVGWEDINHAQVSRDEDMLAKKDKKYNRDKIIKAAHLPLDKNVRPVLSTRLMPLKTGTGKTVPLRSSAGRENAFKLDPRMTKIQMHG
ncbi:hypothetical protein D7B24_007800 [Verticillium nonalfalfae]|uniref:DUF726 domain-containing protein n=1 Tax=Verticillium nonalfalfae TaxID=1051616 RepID=A0A3M9Y711_9PEZI|nr:uncharacterized protein D7B24_007800 [Verticillium nonalfalfae]RNJ56021.1 hypothetical protein D7B24_007800 [Verticillium nonalfalfae]